MSELPKGWTVAPLGEVCGQPAQRVPSADEDFTYIDIASIDRERKVISEPQRLPGAEAPSRARKVVEKGDVIVSMTRPNLNAVALIGEEHNECIASTGFDVLKPIEVEPRWIFAAVRSAQFVDAMCDKVQGALYPAVKSADIREYEIPLPPVAEQTRIAAKLDELLAQVDTLKARIDGIPALLKRFRQSVLAAAVSGRLTEEWRSAARKGPEDQGFAYPLRRLGLLARFIDYRGKTPEKVDSGIPLITAKNIRPGYISREPREFIRPEAYEGWMTRGIPQVGDVLITTEAPLGNVAVIDIKEMFALAQLAICLQFNESFLSSFAAIALQSPLLQEELVRRSTGTTVKGIKASVLKEIDLPAPSIDEQTEIVRRVEQLFAFADQLEAKISEAKTRIDRLTQSILAKAFRGELVPQDPDDEPASALLERIQARRASAPKARRGRRKTENA
ncbi:type I restriction enzyme, S subunit [Azotobacter beijerinckii]|uniref:Type I restriction enzyme, S subunit n=1 Tax=Azotobacter beijerinckii TaxID=170623 RepID=A0A1H6ZQ52_9GAMM|nr:restriction endonuclease subunit S [Azotobacter beijerinckii]SEJ54304.1 type I restriction enzyme, S subunit [Azotobacter beijerinckii]